MSEKTPQDHKAKDGLFTFTHKGKKHELPPVADAAPKVSGGITMDAIMQPDDEMAQLRLGLAMLQASDVPDETMSALRSMSTPDMLETLGAWMQHKSSDEASLGESSSSSN